VPGHTCGGRRLRLFSSQKILKQHIYNYPINVKEHCKKVVAHYLFVSANPHCPHA
jgi:hypothetical protein